MARHGECFPFRAMSQFESQALEFLLTRRHRLRGQVCAIDTREYLISEVDQILGILLHIVGMNPAA